MYIMTNSGILSVLYNDYIKPIKRQLLVLLLVIIFIAAGAYAYKWFASPIFENETGQDVANYNDRAGTIEVYFFHADWCPHCKKASPQWASFVSSYDNQQVNGINVVCVDVDCTDGTDPRIQKYNINGYPTVIILKDGNTINFDSQITSDSLTQFVNSVTQQN